MQRHPSLHQLKGVTVSSLHFSRHHPAITAAALIAPFTIALLSSCGTQNPDAVRSGPGSTQQRSAESPIIANLSPPAGQHARAVPSQQPIEPPHVLICHARDQLDDEIDQFVSSLEETQEASNMAEIRTLRRVYGTVAFLREIDVLFANSHGTTPLSDSQQTELTGLRKRWAELEQLMVKLALTQEKTS